MKNIRTEIRIVVTTYIGDDIDEQSPRSSRRHDAHSETNLVRVSPLAALIYDTHDIARLQVETLLTNSASVIAENIAHQIRKQPHA